MPTLSTTSDWATYLRALASHAPSAPDPHSFTDESGHRREVDLPFIHWLNRHTTPPPDPAPLEAARHSPAPDVALWASLATAQPIPDHILDFHRAHHLRSDFDRASLFPQRNHTGPIALEVWTEVELSSLQALAWMADAQPSLRPLVCDTTHWLLDNLQPDNATNHPWAIHIFIALGMTQPDALLYAQTLLHNCQVTLGRPDALSALILRDAADALVQSSIADWINPQTD